MLQPIRRTNDDERSEYDRVVIWEFECRHCGSFIFFTSGYSSSNRWAREAEFGPEKWAGGHPDECLVCGFDDAPFIWRGHRTRIIVEPRYQPSTEGSHPRFESIHPAANRKS